MILNAHKICIKRTGEKISFMEFVIETISDLLTLAPLQPRNLAVAHDDDVERLTGRHFGSYKEAAEGLKDKHPSKMCRVCYKRGKRTSKGKPLKTTYICRFCPSEPGLHPGECYEIYHTVKHYGANPDDDNNM